MSAENKQSDSDKDKSGKWTDIASFIVAVFALGISIFSLWRSQKVAEYQIEQERLPRITGLNQTIDLQLPKDEDGKIDFTQLPDEQYPIRIPIYNVGVGVAQNCKVEWDEKSVIAACAELEKLLEEKLNVERFTWDDVYEEKIVFYWYDYLVRMDEGKPECITHLAGSEFAYDPILCDMVKYSYILPITEDRNEIYTYLSKGISTLLLEVMNQGVEQPVSLILKVSYQDLTGKEYVEDYLVTFSLASRTEDDEINSVSIIAEWKTPK